MATKIQEFKKKNRAASTAVSRRTNLGVRIFFTKKLKKQAKNQKKATKCERNERVSDNINIKLVVHCS